MDRTPPAEVRRALRQEVGFGCPVNGCRQAFLTWHHFNPPWNAEQHHRPEGMIALCRQHHDAADQGVYSRNELKALKQSVVSVHPTVAALPWLKREFLIRLGGCYSGGMSVAVAVAGKPAIWLRRTDEGLLLLSFRLPAADGSVLAEMEDNMFWADPSRLYDLEASTGGTKLKFWLARRNIGLDLSFQRVTLDELSATLEADRRRAKKAFELQLPAEVQDMLRQAKSDTGNDWFQSLPSFQDIPEEIRDAHLSGDPTGTFVKRWANTHCLDDEQRVALMNFENLCLHDGDRRVVVRNGIAADGYVIGYSSSFGNAAGGFNL